MSVRCGVLVVVALLPACGRVEYEPVARSCRDLLRADPAAPSGTYVVGTADPVEVYCDMDTSGGGWTRVARVVADEGCPGEWVQTSTGPGTACTRPTAPFGTQSWAAFQPPFAEFDEVMGYVRGLQFGSMDGFSESGHGGPRGGVSEIYVDGISIVAFRDRPIHVFTYGVAWSDDDNSENSLCPCLGGAAPASHVGTSFQCESGFTGPEGAGWALDDPLWDGDGTGTDCDSPSAEGRFAVALDATTRGPLLVRLMADQPSTNEDVGVTELELYVR